MEREPRDWADWLMFLLVLIQTGLQLLKKDQSQKKEKPSHRRSLRKRKR